MPSPAWMEFAWSEIGQIEVAGDADNPRISDFYRDAGHPEVVHDEVAWCAAFVGACLKRSKVGGSTSLLARSYLDWGAPITTGKFGAIAIFSRGDDASSGHVAFYLDSDDSRVFVLGGNQGDAVSVAVMERGRLLGLRWPADASAITDPAASIFEVALAHVLAMEGGWTEDPHDPGGPTNFGITLATLAAFRRIAVDAGTFPVLREALRRIGQAEVRTIYVERYWRPCRAANLPPALALMHFDAAVNHGLGASAKMLQESAGVDVDGEIGPQTLSACRHLPVGPMLQRYADIRRARYRALPHFWRFGRGWLARVDATMRLATTLSSSPAKGDTTVIDSQTTLPAQPTKWWGESMTVWGALITAASTVLPALAPIVGLDISGEVIRQLGMQSVQVVQALGGLAGTFMTLYGRFRATTGLERRAVTLQL